MVSAGKSNLLGHRLLLIRVLLSVEFLQIRGLLLLFLCHLIELLYGRFLASACKAQLRLCAKYCFHQEIGNNDESTIMIEIGNKKRNRQK